MRQSCFRCVCVSLRDLCPFYVFAAVLLTFFVDLCAFEMSGRGVNVSSYLFSAELASLWYPVSLWFLFCSCCLYSSATLAGTDTKSSYQRILGKICDDNSSSPLVSKQQLYSVCKNMQTRVVELIPQLLDEGLIEELLVVNDDLNNAFIRYERCAAAKLLVLDYRM